MRWMLVLFVSFSLSLSMQAQDDRVTRARVYATAGQYGQALPLLEARLAEHPDDLDARTLYGIVLSWSGDYARARTELQRVVAADPNNADARTALANVERWSSAQTPRRIREISAGIEHEGFANDSWRQYHVALRHGIYVGRVASASRGDSDDQQFEVEAYPRITPRSYAYVGGGVATEGTLYPEWRIAAEYFHGFGNGFEASAGYRRLAFAESVDIFTASASKYAGNWLFGARVYRPEDGWAWQATARRYYGDGGSFAGLRAGTARDEIRSGIDVQALEHRELVGEGLYITPAGLTIGGRAGITRREDDDGWLAAVTVGWRY